mgnify:CR=1 FL=1
MGGMGETWNSHLPKKGAGRLRDSKNGVLRPGIKGGDIKHLRRSKAAQDADPLFIGTSGTGARAQKPPHWADVDKIAAGQRRIHDYLHEARNRDKIEKVAESLLDKAAGGDYKSAELVLAYFAGKPVAYVSRKSETDLTGDAVAQMAAAVAKDLESKGLRLVKREAPGEEESA